jgi:CheY-like chemotaxis protein
VQERNESFRGAPLVLLIENEENDAFLFRRALSKAEWQGDVRVVESVSEARAYMENSSPFTDMDYFRCPDLIVSDYRLNTQTAQDFIEWLRKHPHFSETPVVILSGVPSQIPPEQLAHLNPAGFIVKTPDVARLAEVLKGYLP